MLNKGVFQSVSPKPNLGYRRGVDTLNWNDVYMSADGTAEKKYRLLDDIYDEHGNLAFSEGGIVSGTMGENEYGQDGLQGTIIPATKVEEVGNSIWDIAEIALKYLGNAADIYSEFKTGAKPSPTGGGTGGNTVGPKPASTGMSPLAITGIVLGSAAVLGLIGWGIYAATK